MFSLIRNVCIFMIILLVCCSCSYLTVDSNFHGQKIENEATASGSHMNAYVWGYYLFGRFPILAGNPEKPGHVVWFSDVVQAGDAVRMLTKKSNEMGADSMTNVSSEVSSTGTFSFWIIYFCDAQASGNAIKLKEVSNAN
jgi:hypothetical protein